MGFVGGMWDARWGRALGLLLVLAGQLQYVSWSSREIAGRWSVPAFAAICTIGALAVFACVRSAFLSFGSGTDPKGDEELPARPWRSPLDAAVLAIGSAYLLAALDDSDAGGRLLELNLFGSLYEPSITIEWFAYCALGAAALLTAWHFLRNRAPGLVMLSMSVIALLLLGEGAARIAVVVAPTSQGFPTASTQMWMRRHSAVNSEGFRDREHTFEKPAHTRRVLVVGDSFTFGQGVDRREDRVSDRLEASLGGVGERIEVINAGLPYTHTLQHIATIERMRRYDPDLVLLLYVYNDIDYIQSGDRPSAVTGATVSVWDRLNPARILFSNSFLYQQIYIRARHVFWRLAASDASVASPYEDPAVVERHLKDLRLFVERASENGATVRIAPFHPPFVVEGWKSEVAKRAFLARLIDEGLPVWALDGAFEGIDYRDLIVNEMDHHPNALANERLAAALVPLIESLWKAP